MKRVIEEMGINVSIIRPDIEITKGNCAYAVSVSQAFFPEVIEILKKYRLLPVRAVLTDGRAYKELKI